VLLLKLLQLESELQILLESHVKLPSQILDVLGCLVVVLLLRAHYRMDLLVRVVTRHELRLPAHI